MSVALCRAVDNVSPDTSKDVMFYKRGDVVTVRDDDFVWGAKETLPDFVKVSFPGVSPADIVAIEQIEHEPLNASLAYMVSRMPAFLAGAQASRPMKRCRKYCIDLDSLSFDADTATATLNDIVRKDAPNT